MTERKNRMIIGNEVTENKKMEGVKEMKLSRSISSINKNLEEVCEAIESAVKLSLKTGKKVSVYVVNGAVVVLQDLEDAEVENIFKTGYLHIVTFELDPNYVYEIMDKQDVEKVLKFFGLTDEEIKRFYDWYERHFYDDVKLSRIMDYSPKLGRRIFNHISDRIAMLDYNSLDIIDSLYQSCTR